MLRENIRSLVRNDDLGDHAEMNNKNNTIQQSSSVVFWLEDDAPKCERFFGDTISKALAHCEVLRRSARDGANISHVSIVTELVDNVTLPGVSGDLPEGYDWKKRRKDYVPGRDPHAKHTSA